jgi:branched-chain amino acid transport system substrate-binding protein
MKTTFRSVRLIGLCLFLVVAMLYSAAAVQAAQPKEIVIGSTLPLTGMLSMMGSEQKWAYEQAAADVNAMGGIYVRQYNKKLPVKLIVADNETDAGKAVAAVERLVKIDKVNFLLSDSTLPLVMPTAVAAEKWKVYYHATICLLPPWLEQKFKWSTDYFFDGAQATSVPFQILDTIPEAERPRRLALLAEDSTDGRTLGPIFEAVGKKYGYEFAYDEPVAVDSKDYSSQILKLKSKGIDGAILFAGSGDCVTFVRQMKEVGLNLKYLHGYKGTWGTEFWNALGKDAQYILADGFWSETYPYPKAKELGEMYYQKFHKRSVSIGLFYAICQTLFKAIEESGTLDGAKVREAVLTTDFKGTVMGDIKYNPDGTAVFPLAGFQWNNGVLQRVYPFIEGASKVMVAPPWDAR